MSKPTVKQDSSKIFVSLAGGIGNQLFQIAAALANSPTLEIVIISNLGEPNSNKNGIPVIAELLDSNQFPLEKEFNFNFLERKMHNLLLRTTKKSNGSNYFQFRWYLHQVLINIFPIFFYKFPNVIAPYDPGYEVIERRRKGSSLFIGYFQSPRYWKNEMRDTLRKTIRLQDNSLQVINLRELSEIELPLIVHIRAGDYSNFPEFGILAPEYYKRAIEFQWKTGKYKGIWVFTNSIHSIDSYLPKEYLKFLRVIDIHEGSASHNLEVMRFGHGYVISNSTYSWWGAFLSEKRNSVVIAPSKWFKMLPEPSNLIPDNWIRMEAEYE